MPSRDALDHPEVAESIVDGRARAGPQGLAAGWGAGVAHTFAGVELQLEVGAKLLSDLPRNRNVTQSAPIGREGRKVIHVRARVKSGRSAAKAAGPTVHYEGKPISRGRAARRETTRREPGGPAKSVGTNQPGEPISGNHGPP